jgi:MerR family transcriptional regulator/heat shock protein HspR
VVSKEVAAVTRDEQHILLSIGIAATRVGMHPQTLREYERQGLVRPQRTPGGTRRYGVAELDRLVRVQRLTAEGLSLAAVRYVLDLEDELVSARARISQLEQGLLQHSMSLELVHVPRAPRSPRWRNED